MDAANQPEPPLTYFEAGERGQIRNGLLRYMRENRIGAPTLQRLIAEANRVPLDQIQLKTLQRFIADTHRSNDVAVRHYRAFLQTLPDDTPFDRLGHELAAFHALGPQCGEGPNSRLMLEQCIGIFSGSALPSPPAEIQPPASFDILRPDGGRVSVPIPPSPKEDVELALSAPHKECTFLRARETVSIHNVGTGEALTYLYDGVAVLTHAGLSVTLRSALTKAPRSLWLSWSVDGFMGWGAEPAGTLEDNPAAIFSRVMARFVGLYRSAGADHE